MLVQFHGQQPPLRPGALLKENEVQDPPFVAVSPYDLFTVLVFDVDAPNPAYLHWAISNVRGDTRAGTELLPYQPPAPPSGTHRYYIVALRQINAASMAPPLPRSGFDLSQFLQDHADVLQLATQTVFLVAAPASDSSS